MKSCGECEHFRSDLHVSWGNCDALVPMWALTGCQITVYAAVSPKEGHDRNFAEQGCECYRERPEKASDRHEAESSGGQCGK